MVATDVLIVFHLVSSILLSDLSVRDMTVGGRQPGQCLLPWDMCLLLLVLTNYRIFPWQVEGCRHRHTRVAYRKVPAAAAAAFAITIEHDHQTVDQSNDNVR